MIIPDVNILLHAYRKESPQHSEARHWWEQTLERQRPIGLAWVTILGFIRITTHRGISVHPLFPADAMRRIQALLENPHVQIIAPGEQHAEILFELLEKVGVAGNLTTDAHLAALALEYQAEIASTDTDFARFPRLRWFNPIQT